ncbi:SCP-2 sterol transfer family protein [Knoellia remsis]|uniref:SCP-2 sterol transfer family protein n=1 Tax=Knoellia remsis TaxID=407159 RepID=A0A2T0UNR8_9MICO|nr:SCP2 sterol-binding domain-containing protein [Knoellia remsis]PRY59518.1 SCP-2 sterol transfer family protein [Knoellia remsis]
MDLDPSTFATMSPAEFAQIVKKLSDKEINEIMGGEHRQAILDGIFDRFPEMFNPEKAKGADARVNWRITGGPGGSDDTYAVVVKDGTVTTEKDPTEEPKTSIMLGPAEFAKLITGSGNPTMMVMMGKVKARGDLAAAMAFQNWFDMPKG